VSDLPDRPGGDDPFEGLPPELRAMLEQLGGPEGIERMQQQLSSLFSGALGGVGSAAVTGPVDWALASRVALQLAEEGDRSATADELAHAQDAFELAEHWLDATPLPAPPDAGRLVVGTRRAWATAALTALRPLVEPVARAATNALVDLAREQFEQLAAEDGFPELEQLQGMPPEVAELVQNLLGGDPAAMLRPAGAAMAGLQAGQVIGQLSQQLLGQYELGVPTAPRAEAHHLAVNVADAFDGYDLDRREVDLVLALTEAAYRRLYHAVPWLEAHVRSLVARFAAGTTVDEERLREMSDELTLGVDPDDPESLRAAMERAASFRLRPTDEQLRILERLQAVVCLVGAWARHEVARAVEGRLPSLVLIDEVLRRRRATKGDGEELLAGLLGLDLQPDDEAAGERFVEAVEKALGPAGLHRALAHPENLPDSEELADPGRWLARTTDDLEVPHDVSELFGDLEEAPHEASADERHEHGDDPDGPAVDPDGPGDEPNGSGRPGTP